MKILAVSTGHDASVTVLEDGKIVFYLSANKITRKKHDNRVLCCLEYLIKRGHTQFTDVIVDFLKFDQERIQNSLKKLLDDNFDYDNLTYTYSEHHLYHAYTGFFNSPFAEAVCIILDGGGAMYDDGKGESLWDNCGSWNQEGESVYKADRHSIREIQKKYFGQVGAPHTIEKQFLLHRQKAISNDDIITFDESKNHMSVGTKFEIVSQDCGFGRGGAGKVMGLAAYKGLESFKVFNWKDKIDRCYEVQKECEEHGL